VGTNRMLVRSDADVRAGRDDASWSAPPDPRVLHGYSVAPAHTTFVTAAWYVSGIFAVLGWLGVMMLGGSVRALRPGASGWRPEPTTCAAAGVALLSVAVADRPGSRCPRGAVPLPASAELATRSAGMAAASGVDSAAHASQGPAGWSFGARPSRPTRSEV
jgi:hypothetical protein